jgi:hypothetical protein
MKFPVSLRIFAIFQLLLGLVSLLTFALLMIGSSDDKVIEFALMLTAMVSLSLFFWSTFSAVVWIFAMRFSYIVLILTIICNAMLLASFDTLFLMQEKLDKTEVVIMAVVTGALGLYIALMIVLAVLKSTRSYFAGEANKPARPVLIAIICVFIGVMAIPASIVGILQAAGSRLEVLGVDWLSSSGDYGEYGVYNVYDDELKTWWTPHSRHGRYAWIQANFYSMVTVHAVEVHPGSHYPDYPDYGDLFPLNRRLSRAKVIFSDGTHQEIALEDRDEVQIIKLEPKDTTRVRLQVLETRKGQRWDDLCISQFKVLKKTRRFKEIQ